MKLHLLLLPSAFALVLTSCFGPSSSSSSASSSQAQSSSETSITSSSEGEKIAGRFHFDANSESVVEEGVSILTATDDYGNSLRLKAVYTGASCFGEGSKRAIYNLDPIQGVAEMEFHLEEDRSSIGIFAVASSNPLDEHVLEAGYDDVVFQGLNYAGYDGSTTAELDEIKHLAYFCLYAEENPDSDNERIYPLKSFTIYSAFNEVDSPTGIPYFEHDQEIQNACRNLFSGTEIPYFNGAGIQKMVDHSDYYASFEHYYWDFSVTKFSSMMRELGFRELESTSSSRHRYYFENGYGWSKSQTITIDADGYRTGGVALIKIWMQHEGYTKVFDGWPSDELRTLFGAERASLLPTPEMPFTNDRFVVRLNYNGEFLISCFYDSSDEDYGHEAVAHYAQQLYRLGFRKTSETGYGDISYLFHKDGEFRINLAAIRGEFMISGINAGFLDTFPINLLCDTLDGYIDIENIPVPEEELGAYYNIDDSLEYEQTSAELFPNAYSYIRIFDVNEDVYYRYRDQFESNGLLQGDAWHPAFVTFSDINEDGTAYIYVESGIDENVQYATDFVEGLSSSFGHFTMVDDEAIEAFGSLIEESFPTLASTPLNTVDSWADWKTLTGIYVQGISYKDFCEGIGATYRLHDNRYLGTVIGASSTEYRFLIEGYDTVSGCHLLFSPDDRISIETVSDPAPLLEALGVDASLALLPNADAYALSDNKIQLYFYSSVRKAIAMSDYYDALIEAGFIHDPYDNKWVKAIEGPSYFIIEEDTLNQLLGFASDGLNPISELKNALEYPNVYDLIQSLDIYQTGARFYLAPNADTEAQDAADIYVTNPYDFVALTRRLRMDGFYWRFNDPNTFIGVIEGETSSYEYTVSLDRANHHIIIQRTLIEA